MAEELQDQTNNRPWLYKKGQSGNPAGRPVGSKTLKTWLRERFARMSDEEREEFFEGMNKIDLFKMAEGMPETKTDITSGGKPIPIYGGQSINIPEHDSDEESIPAQEAN